MVNIVCTCMTDNAVPDCYISHLVHNLAPGRSVKADIACREGARQVGEISDALPTRGLGSTRQAGANPTRALAQAVGQYDVSRMDDLASDLASPSVGPLLDRPQPSYRRCNSDPGLRLKSKSLFLPSKYRLKSSASSSLMNSTCMITLSCSRSYLNVEGAHL